MAGYNYAVAVRDGGDLFLFWSIHRSVSGDIYVNYPGRKDLPGWKPHTSHHRDGRNHLKSFGRKFMGRQGTVPDATFDGTFQIDSTLIEPSDVRAINCRVTPSAYQEVFEIDIVDLRPNPRATQISVDITDASTPPLLMPGVRIIRSFIGKDALPWVVVTLYELPKCE
jgi:hypothetical protein